MTPLVRIVPFTNVGAENPYAIALLADRRVVVNGLRRDVDSDSLLPLHIVGPDGMIEHSFGDRAFTPVDIRRPSQPFLRALARANDGGLWAAHRFQYRIDKWTARGELERTITVQAEWFPAEPVRPPGDGLDFGPSSGVALLSIVETPDGLWVAIRVPQPDAPPGPRATGSPWIEDPYRDTMIQLLDPRTGEIRASVRIDARIDSFACSDVLVSYAEDAEGYPYVQTWRVRVAS